MRFFKFFFCVFITTTIVSRQGSYMCVAVYVFLSIKIILSPKADLYKLVGQEPYYRDALVRIGHRQNLGVPGDPNRVDEALLKAALKREVASFIDPRLIARIEIVRQDPKKRIARTVPAKP